MMIIYASGMHTHTVQIGIDKHAHRQTDTYMGISALGFVVKHA